VRLMKSSLVSTSSRISEQTIEADRERRGGGGEQELLGKGVVLGLKGGRGGGGILTCVASVRLPRTAEETDDR
jgi:hypothetical protein